MARIYCISGVGADARIFKKLDIPGYEIAPVPWVPFDSRDDIRSYAKKLSDQIPEENPILLGLSFGGMLCVEIGKIRPTKKIFLVSSAKSTSQLPRIGRLPNASFLLSLTPDAVFSNPALLNTRLIGAKSDEDRELLLAMMKASAPGFIKWALKAIVNWHNKSYPTNIIQLHGTADLVIPSLNVRADYWVKGGTHVMVYNQAAEVSKIISDCLA